MCDKKLEYIFIFQDENNCRIVDHGVQAAIQEIGGLSQGHVNIRQILGEKIVRTGLGGVYQRVPLSSNAIG